MDGMIRTQSLIEEPRGGFRRAGAGPGPPAFRERDGSLRLDRPPHISVEEMYQIVSDDDDDGPLPRGWESSTAFVPARPPYLNRKVGSGL